MEIRPLHDPAGAHAVEALQAEVWDRDQVVPLNQLLATVRTGGLLLGAVDGDDLLGFVYSFAAWRRGQPPWLHSHMLAVRERARGLGIGRALKLAQRREAIALGYGRMTWTYDPLQAPNAHLNIARLGAVARHYEVAAYGEMNDPLNAGVASDRLLAEWDLCSARVRARLDDGAGADVADARRVDGDRRAQADAAPLVNPLLDAPSGTWPRVAEVDLDRQEALLRLAMPDRLGDLKAADLDLARRWRAWTRTALLHYFGRGYAIVDLQREPGLCHYLLAREG